MAFYEIFESLCKERGVSPTRAARDNGLKQQSVSSWKTRGSTPKAETVQKLADYFGVSVDYLLGRERVIIPGRLKFVEINDPQCAFVRYDVQATDQEAFEHGLQILERAGLGIESYTPQAQVLSAMERLNSDGQHKAAERVRELTEIPRYQLRRNPQPPQEAPQSTPAPTEGQSTTPPPDAPETPPEGK